MKSSPLIVLIILIFSSLYPANLTPVGLKYGLDLQSANAGELSELRRVLASGEIGENEIPSLRVKIASTETSKNKEIAIFAGGCFWCVESDFDSVDGVLKTISGYTGGRTKNPTYRKVGSGGTGHYEAVEITYDPSKVSYSQLVEIFWRSVDPTDDGGQFCDRGESYRTAIFAVDDQQAKIAKESKAKHNAAKRLPRAIITPILKAQKFYPAEDYHQNYYQLNPVRYKFYRYSCGRDRQIKALWGDEAHQGLAKH